MTKLPKLTEVFNVTEGSKPKEVAWRDLGDVEPQAWKAAKRDLGASEIAAAMSGLSDRGSHKDQFKVTVYPDGWCVAPWEGGNSLYDPENDVWSDSDGDEAEFTRSAKLFKAAHPDGKLYGV